MAYTIKFANKSMNADRIATLKGWDRSEINVLRVVTNEIIHSMETGDYRGLRTVFEHVEGRKQVFNTLRAILKAVTGKTFNVSIGDEGLSMTIAPIAKRAYDNKLMGKLVAARDGAKTGIFNNAFLMSLGIGVKKDKPDFDLEVAATSLVKRATEANIDRSVVMNAIRSAFDTLNNDDETVETTKLQAVG